MNLIIGGSGFVGSFLLKELKNHKFINLDKHPSPFFNNKTFIGDIRNLEEIKIPIGTTSVTLLAAEHRDDISPISLYYDVNVQGTKNVLKAMDLAGVTNLIFTSSVAIYGLNKKNPNETHKEDPFNHYGKSKWEAELLIKEWYESDPNNKSVTILRPTVIFGERNRIKCWKREGKRLWNWYIYFGWPESYMVSSYHGKSTPARLIWEVKLRWASSVLR